jgi:surface protein
MKKLTTYITEALRIKSGAKFSSGPKYKYHPKTKDELKEIIKELLQERGWESDLNDIDTSKITDMSNLFDCMIDFNCDISKWDVSNVEDMYGMFAGCHNFDSDLSYWNVSNVENMHGMFYECDKFNCDLSSLIDGSGMFFNCRKLESFT